MAKNTGDGYREGEVRDRSQVYNPVTKKWTKRDAGTGEFMDVKEDGEPFKGATMGIKYAALGGVLVARAPGRAGQVAGHRDVAPA